MRRWLIACAIAAIIICIAALDPIPQDPAYHDFAETRMLLSIANFWNVASNVPLLAVGVVGLGVVFGMPRVVDPACMRAPWLVFFSGIVLTAFGSGYFHLAPSNASLVWDRLAMTFGFAGFFAVVVGEYLSPVAATRLLAPLIVAGILSVLYWNITESAGRGDLRAYAIVQFLPVLLTPAILILRQRASDLTPALWLVVSFYVLAKILEHFDHGILAMTGVVSGHTLKHVAAALGPAVLIRALLARRGEPVHGSHPRHR